jgi:glycyl-tRNA synthetase
MITLENLTAYAKQYGFIFQGSEIYNGLANTWDYGPTGAILKNNLRQEWKKYFIQEKPNAFEVDSAILMNPRVWEASGHIGNFNDPLIDCKSCKMRYRADTLIQEFYPDEKVDLLDDAGLVKFIIDKQIKCPKCGKIDYTDIRKFNLMFETHRGVTADKGQEVYLRPENAQGEYLNFINVHNSMRAKLPFAIGQTGKAFRNEITPGNFTFRTIEFEQMEYQVFCRPGTDEELYNQYKNEALTFFKSLGIKEESLRFHDHDKLAHYAKAACDIEYKFDFGWGEINGTHNRTDFDLSRHQQFSGKKLEYLDPTDNQKFIPFVIESTVGLDRLVLTVLVDAYEEQTLEDGSTREVMHIAPKLAPYKIAVLPLIKKLHNEKAEEVFAKLAKKYSTNYDVTGSIGKRYRRQDCIGTPYCLTVDEETLTNNTVTIRNRDTMLQDTVKLDELEQYLSDKF